MTEFEDIATYIFTWHAFSDACRKCRYLDGKEWSDQDLFQEVLWDPIWGDIWDLDAGHSLAHGREQYNCRCQLTVRVEKIEFEQLSDVQELNDLLERWL